MIDIQRRRASFSTGGLSRRGFVRVGTLGLIGISLADWFGLKARADMSTAKAKSVIHLWMGGGPSHLDTFDPRAEAGEEYCGPLKNPFATNVPGIRICELLPKMAQQADKYTLIRGMTHPDFGHETATYTSTTGTVPTPDLVYPSMGSVVAYKKGYSREYKGSLPPYITLTNPLGRFSDSGFLGSQYNSFSTFGDPSSKDFRVQGLMPPGGVTDARVDVRRDLQHAIDTFARDADERGLLHNLDSNRDQAYGVILGDARKAFDLSQEKDDLRDRYGLNPFGQSCLLARRLVENGVPFITINMPGWDTHTDNFGVMKDLLLTLDGGFATLLADLAERGLLESTLVVWYGEFGRTTKVDMAPPWTAAGTTTRWRTRPSSPGADSGAIRSSAPATTRASTSRTARSTPGTLWPRFTSFSASSRPNDCRIPRAASPTSRRWPPAPCPRAGF